MATTTAIATSGNRGRHRETAPHETGRERHKDAEAREVLEMVGDVRVLEREHVHESERREERAPKNNAAASGARVR
jgi:hypothetical protein